MSARLMEKLFVGLLAGWVMFASGWVPARAANLGLAMQAAATNWSQGHNSRARVVVSDIAEEPWSNKRIAGVHVQLDDDWKTYWRAPGDAGGIPPHFDWSGSRNVARADVLYPAPGRLKDAYGQSVGYKHEVLFPVVLTPKDPSKPMHLRLNFAYGVCKDICIPAEAQLEMQVGAVSVGTEAGPLLRRYLDRVPIEGASAAKIVKFKSMLDGDRPEFVVDALFEQGAEGADLFVEAADGIFVPLPKIIPTKKNGHVRFQIDLTKAEDPKLFKGRALKLTLVSDRAQSETAWQLE